MPSRTASTLAMYSSGVWSHDDLRVGALGVAPRHRRLRCASDPVVESSPQLEIVPEPLDLLLLAIHVVNVVAQE